MIWVDYCILVTIAVSTVVGVVRGFTRESLALLTWVIAIGATYLAGDALANRLEGLISVPSIRIATGYGAVFLIVLATGAVATHLASGLIRRSPFAGPDRTLGGGFGMLRGGAIIAGLVFLIGMTPARQDAWWSQSIFIHRFEHVAQWLRARMPPEWQGRIEQLDQQV